MVTLNFGDISELITVESVRQTVVHVSVFYVTLVMCTFSFHNGHVAGNLFMTQLYLFSVVRDLHWINCAVYLALVCFL